MYFLTIASLALSIWLISYGLQLRFFGSYIDSGIFRFLTPPIHLMTLFTWVDSGTLGFDLGWPLIVIGCSLLGTLLGVWLRQSWSRGSLIVFAIASLITLHWMNLLSILLLVISFTPSLRSWLVAEKRSDE